MQISVHIQIRNESSRSVYWLLLQYLYTFRRGCHLQGCNNICALTRYYFQRLVSIVQVFKRHTLNSLCTCTREQTFFVGSLFHHDAVLAVANCSKSLTAKLVGLGTAKKFMVLITFQPSGIWMDAQNTETLPSSRSWKCSMEPEARSQHFYRPTYRVIKN